MSKITVKFKGLENLTAKISLEKMLKDNSTFSYTVFYEKDPTNYLAELCDKYGCDKGEIKTTGHPYRWPSHTYADFMSSRFGHCREMIRRVFECGLGTNNPNLPQQHGDSGQTRRILARMEGLLSKRNDLRRGYRSYHFVRGRAN